MITVKVPFVSFSRSELDKPLPFCRDQLISHYCTFKTSLLGINNKGQSISHVPSDAEKELRYSLYFNRPNILTKCSLITLIRFKRLFWKENWHDLFYHK